MYSAIDSTTLAYPTELLNSEKHIDLGGITVVIEPHPGHTPTDRIVRILDRDIVFTGDLLFYRAYPVSFDVEMIGWRKALGTFVGYGPQMRFIPGHGDVCGIEIARQQIDQMEDILVRRRMKAAGMVLDEAKRGYAIPARFREFGLFCWNWTIGAAIEKYYR